MYTFYAGPKPKIGIRADVPEYYSTGLNSFINGPALLPYQLQMAIIDLEKIYYFDNCLVKAFGDRAESEMDIYIEANNVKYFGRFERRTTVKNNAQFFQIPQVFEIPIPQTQQDFANSPYWFYNPENKNFESAMVPEIGKFIKIEAPKGISVEYRYDKNTGWVILRTTPARLAKNPGAWAVRYTILMDMPNVYNRPYKVF